MVSVPTVSVVMSVYNQEPYVKESINSVLAQTYSNFELIIIDDGSTDKSDDIVRTFTDSRIRYYLNEKNMGIVATSNRGLSLAKGRYIARLDSDDNAAPDRLERQVSFLESNPEIGLVGSYFETIESVPRVVRPPLTHEEISDTLLVDNCFGHSTVMFRRELFELNGLEYPDVGGGAEDYAFYLASIPFVRMANIPDVLLFYRVHEAQISNVQNALQTSFANEVRIRYVEKRLGRPLLQDEQDVHNLLCSGEVKTRDGLKKCSMWIRLLYSHCSGGTDVLLLKLREEYRRSVRQYGPTVLCDYLKAETQYGFSIKELKFLFLSTASWVKFYTTSKLG